MPAPATWAPLVPELIVIDITASLHFWVDLIGFTLCYQREEEGFVYLDLGGAQIMLEEHRPANRQWLTGDLVPPLGRGINFQLEVAACAPILARFAAENYPLYLKPEEKWYRSGGIEHGQRQFLVQDPDGYLLRLAEHLADRPFKGTNE